MLMKVSVGFDSSTLWLKNVKTVLILLWEAYDGLELGLEKSDSF
jgi:hypothetical protein